MTRIANLTQEQEDLMEIYVDKYIQIGLNTDRFDETFATPIIHAFQEQILETPKTPVIVFNNPLECMVAILLFEDEDKVSDKVWDKVCDKVRAKVSAKVSDKVWDKVWAKVWAKVSDKVWDKVRAKVRAKVSAKVSAKVRAKVRDKVSDKVWAKVSDKVWDKVSAKVRAKVSDKVRAKVRAKVSDMQAFTPYLSGSLDASIFSFYDYCKEVLNIDFSEYAYQAWQNTLHLGLIYPLDDICIVCQKPTAIRFRDEGKLHADGKMAIEYAGRWGIYALNDIAVPEYLAMNNAGNLDIDFFFQEKNADIKAEFIRKYGIDRMLKLGKLVDSYKNYNNKWWIKSEYEIWDMRELFEGITRHPQCCFLKMRNITTGTWHLEGISPLHGEVDSIAKALEIREKVLQEQTNTLWIA